MGTAPKVADVGAEALDPPEVELVSEPAAARGCVGEWVAGAEGRDSGEFVAGAEADFAPRDVDRVGDGMDSRSVFFLATTVEGASWFFAAPGCGRCFCIGDACSMAEAS